MRQLSRLVWFAALVLTATACASDSSNGDSTGLDTAPLASIVLGEDGLGDVLLGFPPEVVVADISALFGEPDVDSDWLPAEPNIYGTCPGRQMRAVGWGSLVTIFINEETDPLGERFFTYTYGYDYNGNEGGVDPRGLNLTTDDGIGIGSSVTELREVYGDALAITGDSELDLWSFTVTESPLQGLLDGPDDSDQVTLIELVPGC